MMTLQRCFNHLSVLAVIYIGLAGCSGAADPSVPPTGFSGTIHDVLKNADSFELLSLSPVLIDVPDGEFDPATVFHDYRILGSLLIDDTATRTRLIAALYEGVHVSDGDVADCFNPRHGIRATLGEDRVDIVICFECLSMNIHMADGTQSGATTTESPAKLFNTTLRDAGVHLSNR